MLQGPEVLEHGIGPLGRGRRADSRLLRVCSSGVGRGFFVGVSTPMPAPWYPLSASTGIPSQADRYRAGSTWSLAAVRSWVEPGSTGPVYTGNPAKVHHHLHVAAERPGLARIPQVAARVRVALGHPVGVRITVPSRLDRPGCGGGSESMEG